MQRQLLETSSHQTLLRKNNPLQDGLGGTADLCTHKQTYIQTPHLLCMNLLQIFDIWRAQKTQTAVQKKKGIGTYTVLFYFEH